MIENYVATTRALLSHREKEVIYFLIRGLTAKLISNKLMISPRTVEQHLKNIKYKTHAHSKTELIAMFFEEFKEPGYAPETI